LAQPAKSKPHSARITKTRFIDTSSVIYRGKLAAGQDHQHQQQAQDQHITHIWAIPERQPASNASLSSISASLSGSSSRMGGVSTGVSAKTRNSTSIFASMAVKTAANHWLGVMESSSLVNERAIWPPGTAAAARGAQTSASHAVRATGGRRIYGAKVHRRRKLGGKSER
jgi:hypothetical protein